MTEDSMSNPDYEELIRQANDARTHSYAPYSNFRVGAALLAKSGRIYTGCNIENVSYSTTMCAERVALGAAIAAGEPVGDFPVIAVVGGLHDPTPPCGVCRQVLSELAPGVLIVMASDPEKGDGKLVLTIEELLPHGFATYKETSYDSHDEGTESEGRETYGQLPRANKIREDDMKRPFEIGSTYNRRQDIHAKYGGQEQGGISTPSGHPYVFLFSADVGSEYGYKDGWTSTGIFLYTGEGQIGDMEFVRGNKAIRDHEQHGKELHVFKSSGKSGNYEYLGKFVCADWESRRGLDAHNHERSVIVFHLVEDN